MNQMVKGFMGRMEKIDNALEKIPGKTGVKIGAVTGLLVMTSPVVAGLVVGAAGAYGVYKLAKCAQEKDDNIIDAEAPSSQTDA